MNSFDVYLCIKVDQYIPLKSIYFYTIIQNCCMTIDKTTNMRYNNCIEENPTKEE